MELPSEFITRGDRDIGECDEYTKHEDPINTVNGILNALARNHKIGCIGVEKGTPTILRSHLAMCICHFTPIIFFECVVLLSQTKFHFLPPEYS